MEAKLIKLLLLFLLPLLVLFGIAEYCMSKADNAYTIKRKTLDKKAESLELVFMGNSQTYYSINPALFKEPSLNLANLGQPVKYDCEILLKYLPKLKHLKLVLLSVEYLTLFYDVETNPPRGYLYYQYWGIDDASMVGTDIQKYSKLIMFKPSTSLNIFFEMIKQKKFNIRFQAENMTDDGFDTLTRPADTLHFEEKAATVLERWGNKIMSQKYYSRNARMLESLVRILEERKIKVLFISSPVRPGFFLRYDSSYTNKTSKFINYITGKYDNTAYVDFTKDMRFLLADFADPNHLNANGASRFSTILRDEYIKPMLH